MRRLSERLTPQDYSRIAAGGAQEDIAAARLLENWIATVEGHVGSSLRRGRNGNSENRRGAPGAAQSKSRNPTIRGWADPSADGAPVPPGPELGSQ